MFEVEKIEDWYGQDVVDNDGDKVGKLEEVFTDIQSKQPTIGSVKTGLFGRKLSLVPLEGATLTRDHLRLPYTKDQIKGAPQADGGGQLDGEGERDIFSYYGMEQPERTGEEASTVRYETAGAADERKAEAEELRAKAEQLDQRAEQHGGRAAEAEETAKEARSTHDEAVEAQSSDSGEAEQLRQKADEIERS